MRLVTRELIHFLVYKRYRRSMIHYDRRIRLLGIGLAFLAGLVDATGFLALNGFFVSFMSGNSTRLGVGLSQFSASAGIAGGLIVSFLVGVIAGSLVGAQLGQHRKSGNLALVGLLLAIAGAFGELDFLPGAAVAMALAMGVENTVFDKSDQLPVGLTYMTGTLVKLGQAVAGAFLNETQFAWLPYLLHWIGLMLGAVTGAVLYPFAHFSTLWFASAAALFGAAMLLPKPRT